jgi:hypothetical protein
MHFVPAMVETMVPSQIIASTGKAREAPFTLPLTTPIALLGGSQ